MNSSIPWPLRLLPEPAAGVGALVCALVTLASVGRGEVLGAPAPLPTLAAFAAQMPHPAVVRIIVPEGDATSYGSGTLIDVRDQFGLVITNWHVVRDGKGDVEVVFPDGFRSQARPLKVDADWDLAALVIWRPPAAPVRIAARAPQSGDQLTICGYGQGQYRAATGRCTKYYAPKLELPQHMVELDVEARQGDSGGPIFNDRGELAGVLFGAGGGTTLGSFGGRVQTFLTSLAPDIGRAPDVVPRPAISFAQAAPAVVAETRTITMASATSRGADSEAEPTAAIWKSTDAASKAVDDAGWQTPVAAASAPVGSNSSATPWFDHAKTILAAIGVVALVVQAVRAVG